jgi:hypothetical protein
MTSKLGFSVARPTCLKIGELLELPAQTYFAEMPPQDQDVFLRLRKIEA